MLSLTTLINAKIRARLKARAASKATTGRTISEAARADPVAAAEEVFGLTVWSRQREVLTAARLHERVSVRSGHKVSKSTSAALLAWWFTFDAEGRPGARSIITAPTARQVREIVWREVKALHARAARRGYRLPIPGDNPGTGARWGDGREVIGFTIDEGRPEAIAGFSGAHILFIGDEASGIGDPIFEAIDGNAAGNARVFIISNPTRTAGAFFASQQPGSDYYPLHIDSRASPNVTGEARIPGLATPEWVAKMETKYGADSLFCRVRVHGEFPDQAEDEVFGAAIVRAAQRRAPSESAEPLVCGLDVAEFGGDVNVLAPRRGLCHLPLVRLAAGDSHAVAGQALRALRRLKRHRERPRVNVDATGVGAGVVSALRSESFTWDNEVFRPRDEVDVVAVKTGAGAAARNVYANLRAELHFMLKEHLRAASLPPDNLLDEDLRAPKYQLDRDGRILIEPKEKIRGRLGRSPDSGDAVILSLARPAGAAGTGSVSL